MRKCLATDLPFGPLDPPGPQDALRGLFLSDLHIGLTRGRPREVVEFLQRHPTQALYLVGDIFEGWDPTARRARPGAQHRLLLDQLDRLAQAGTRIVLTPGNHDRAFRRLAGRRLGPIEIHEEARHVLADGRQVLVTHGDCIDPLMGLGSTLSWMGGQLDGLARLMGRGLGRYGGAEGRRAARWIEARLVGVNALMHPQALSVDRLTARARTLGFHGVICGHFHIPDLRDGQMVIYANCGDWLDHCTAVTEANDGRLRLVRWPVSAVARGMTPALAPALASGPTPATALLARPASDRPGGAGDLRLARR